MLVIEYAEASYLISSVFESWKPDFKTKSGALKAGIDFRISERMMSNITSHIKGFFSYWSQKEGEKPQVVFTHF